MNIYPVLPVEEKAVLNRPIIKNIHGISSKEVTLTRNNAKCVFEKFNRIFNQKITIKGTVHQDITFTPLHLVRYLKNNLPVEASVLLKGSLVTDLIHDDSLVMGADIDIAFDCKISKENGVVDFLKIEDCVSHFFCSLVDVDPEKEKHTKIDILKEYTRGKKMQGKPYSKEGDNILFIFLEKIDLSFINRAKHPYFFFNDALSINLDRYFGKRKKLTLHSRVKFVRIEILVAENLLDTDQLGKVHGYRPYLELVRCLTRGKTVTSTKITQCFFDCFCQTYSLFNFEKYVRKHLKSDQERFRYLVNFLAINKVKEDLQECSWTLLKEFAPIEIPDEILKLVVMTWENKHIPDTNKLLGLLRELINHEKEDEILVLANRLDYFIYGRKPSDFYAIIRLHIRNQPPQPLIACELFKRSKDKPIDFFRKIPLQSQSEEVQKAALEAMVMREEKTATAILLDVVSEKKSLLQSVIDHSDNKEWIQFAKELKPDKKSLVMILKKSLELKIPVDTPFFLSVIRSIKMKERIPFILSLLHEHNLCHDLFTLGAKEINYNTISQKHLKSCWNKLSVSHEHLFLPLLKSIYQALNEKPEIPPQLKEHISPPLEDSKDPLQPFLDAVMKKKRALRSDLKPKQFLPLLQEIAFKGVDANDSVKLFENVIEMLFVGKEDRYDLPCEFYCYIFDRFNILSPPMREKLFTHSLIYIQENPSPKLVPLLYKTVLTDKHYLPFLEEIVNRYPDLAAQNLVDHFEDLVPTLYHDTAIVQLVSRIYTQDDVKVIWTPDVRAKQLLKIVDVLFHWVEKGEPLRQELQEILVQISNRDEEITVIRGTKKGGKRKSRRRVELFTPPKEKYFEYLLRFRRLMISLGTPVHEELFEFEDYLAIRVQMQLCRWLSLKLYSDSLKETIFSLMDAKDTTLYPIYLKFYLDLNPADFVFLDQLRENVNCGLLSQETYSVLLEHPLKAEMFSGKESLLFLSAFLKLFHEAILTGNYDIWSKNLARVWLPILSQDKERVSVLCQVMLTNLIKDAIRKNSAYLLAVSLDYLQMMRLNQTVFRSDKILEELRAAVIKIISSQDKSLSIISRVFLIRCAFKLDILIREEVQIALGLLKSWTSNFYRLLPLDEMVSIRMFDFTSLPNEQKERAWAVFTELLSQLEEKQEEKSEEVPDLDHLVILLKASFTDFDPKSTFAGPMLKAAAIRLRRQDPAEVKTFIHLIRGAPQ